MPGARPGSRSRRTGRAPPPPRCEIAAPERWRQFTELNNSPTRYLTSRVFAASRARKEMIVLALIKLAGGDLDNAARQLEDKWGPQLSPEERNWVWGVIGKQAAQTLVGDALAHYAKVSRDSDLTDDMLAWKVRAALRAARGPQWPARAAGRQRHERGGAGRAGLGLLEGPRPAGPGRRRPPRRGPGAARVDRLGARLLRAAGAGGAGPEDHRAAAPGAAHGRREGSRAAEPEPESRRSMPSRWASGPKACASGTGAPTWPSPAA